MSDLELILGKKSEMQTVGDFLSFAQSYQSIHMDLGTGDGLFAWRLARECPNIFVAGIDADRNSLAEASARSIKKPARGGAPNARFLCMNVLDDLPEEFQNVADTVSINFPWGSLLYAVALPQEQYVEKFAKLVKEGGKLDLHINLHVFVNEEQRANMGLPELDDAYFLETVAPVYEKFGLKLVSHTFIPAGIKVDVASTWGGRLTRRSGRPTLSAHFVKVKS